MYTYPEDVIFNRAFDNACARESGLVRRGKRARRCGAIGCVRESGLHVCGTNEKSNKSRWWSYGASAVRIIVGLLGDGQLSVFLLEFQPTRQRPKDALISYSQFLYFIFFLLRRTVSSLRRIEETCLARIHDFGHAPRNLDYPSSPSFRRFHRSPIGYCPHASGTQDNATMNLTPYK